ncbi:(d)CMP kinase [bacterium]|nr:(d)CMP kinase [bacterium]
MIITIDGPTASGKSTVAKLLAKQLGMYYLGTGLMFRGIAYLLLKKASYTLDDFKNPDKNDILYYLDPKKFFYEYDETGKEKILFNGENITPFLKNSQIDRAASILSTNKLFRLELLKLQQTFTDKFDCVAEGRDVGSVVFPKAKFKFFLTAAVEIRAQRWKNDQEKKGNSFSLAEAIVIINERDTRDRNREVAPLVKPEGAFVIDNSDLTLQKTLDTIKNFIKNRPQI